MPSEIIYEQDPDPRVPLHPGVGGNNLGPNHGFRIGWHNLLSHGRYSLYEPVEMLKDNKLLFRDILDAFLAKHAFELPALLNETPAPAPAAPQA